MAMFFFDPSKVESVYAEGRRKGRIIKVDMIPVRNGPGRYLQLSVAFGRNGDLVIKDNFNLENANPTAVRIAQEKLSAVYKSAGLGPADVVALQGKIVDCELKKKPSDSGKMYLEIDEYYPQAAYPTQQQQAQQQQQQQGWQPPPQPAYQQPQHQQPQNDSDVPF